MEKERMTIYDMILQIINSNQLSADEEAEVLGILRKREEEREKKRMSRCLAGVIEEKMQKMVEEGIIKEATKTRYHPIYKRCFLETNFGNLDATEITEAEVEEFIIEAHESFGLNRNDMLCFMGLLQKGLNELSDRGLLTFVPDKQMYRSYVESDRENKYIDNPYSEEETERIMKWIEEHSDTDIRALAVGLWLTGNISPEEIIGLKKDDCWNSDNGIEKGIFKEDEKKKYVTEAFKLHPDEEQYIFMLKKEGRWRRLNERSLQIKLYYICRSIGITYRAFHKNEIIIPDK